MDQSDQHSKIQQELDQFNAYLESQSATDPMERFACWAIGTDDIAHINKTTGYENVFVGTNTIDSADGAR